MTFLDISEFSRILHGVILKIVHKNVSVSVLKVNLFKNQRHIWQFGKRKQFGGYWKLEEFIF